MRAGNPRGPGPTMRALLPAAQSHVFGGLQVALGTGHLFGVLPLPVCLAKGLEPAAGGRWQVGYQREVDGGFIPPQAQTL